MHACIHISGCKIVGQTPDCVQNMLSMQSYFMGLLRTKMSELQSEIGKISREVEAANEEQSTFLAYDKRVKELAAELTGKPVCCFKDPLLL